MSKPYADLHVVVTGGGGALGTAVVERLLDAGARCRVPTYGPSELERFSLKDHERVETLDGLDLADPAHVDGLYEPYGPATALWASIHVAGGFHWGKIEDADHAVFDRMWAMNAQTAYLCARRAVMAMRAGGRGGRIVNVAARPALSPGAGAGMVAYTAAKAAVAALTVALAQEVAADGIWVNAVAPSIIDTPANRAAMPDADHDAWPTPTDIADTILFLASPENRATRGGVVPVYGRA